MLRILAFCILVQTLVAYNLNLNIEMENQLQTEDPLLSPMCHTPLFSFNPNSFPYMLTYQQPTDTVDQKEKAFLTLKLSGNGESMGKASGIKIRTKGKLPILRLEKHVNEVIYIVTRGCYCRSKNCFLGLDPENIYKHRQFMSKLAKAEHDMFLKGVVITCLSSYKGVVRTTYMKYTYNSKRVCKEAFLYLHFCTRQQLEEVRGHFVMYSVSPVLCNNHDSAKSRSSCEEELKSLKEFLSLYVDQHIGKENIDEYQNIFVPLGITKKSVHQAYMVYMQKYRPDRKCMNYSTFRNMLRDHFSQIIFYRFGRQSALPETQLENSIVQTMPYQDQVFLDEDKSFLELLDPLPSSSTEISKNSDAVCSFSSNELAISDV